MGTSNQPYPLQRGYRSSARLNLQHFLWRQSTGYLLHPAIPVPNDAHIADVGTGTAIWLLELASRLPQTVQLEGLDISLAQAPAAPWLPDNVKLRLYDIYDPLPEDLIGVYDIIHVRFFLCVVRESDPAAILRRLARMLKPGGWLQWTEQDIQTLHVEQATSTKESGAPYMHKMLEIAKAPTSQWPVESQSWVKHLQQTFHQEGFVDVEEQRHERPAWLRAAFQDVTMLAMDEMTARRTDAADVQTLIGEAAREVEESGQGVAVTSTGVTVIGRRPSI